MVRGGIPPAALTPAIRRAVAGVDPLLAISGMSTMEQALGNLSSLDAFVRWLLTLLGATGLVLALVGVYGVMAYFVVQRHHELGVRLALGAPGWSLEWLVVRQGIGLALVGVAVGVPLALLATRLLRVFVFGITPHDPATFAVVGAVLVVVAAAAAFIPARRTTKMDPLEALRSG
jgi:ABC-type antimicrobial peptide transport system permease subunit